MTSSEELDVFALADLFQGHTIADIEGAMQYALNLSITQHKTSDQPEIGREAIHMACRVVLSKNETSSAITWSTHANAEKRERLQDRQDLLADDRFWTLFGHHKETRPYDES